MSLILLSILCGYLGLHIGGMLGADIYGYLFGVIGVLSPGLYTLEKIYQEVQKKDN